MLTSRADTIGLLRSRDQIKMEDCSKTKVNVTITSDVVCPWCWVGKRHLDAAMKELQDEFDFSITWKPFLLNPNAPEEGIPVEDMLARKYGPEAKEKYLSGQLSFFQAGKEVGITFTKERLSLPTKKAHLLMDYALDKNQQHEFQENLFKAYFTDTQNINSPEVLRKILSDSGLDAEEGIKALGDAQRLEKYKEEIAQASGKGISGVPFFEISLPDHPRTPAYSLSGAQPIKTFVLTFKRLQSQAKI